MAQFPVSEPSFHSGWASNYINASPEKDLGGLEIYKDLQAAEILWVILWFHPFHWRTLSACLRWTRGHFLQISRVSHHFLTPPERICIVLSSSGLINHKWQAPLCFMIIFFEWYSRRPLMNSTRLNQIIISRVISSSKMECNPRIGGWDVTVSLEMSSWPSCL